MVRLYCSHHHGPGGLCVECAELIDYADRRLDLCPYGAEKPSCTNCPIHCYRPEPRQRMREVMDDRRPVPPLPERTRSRSDSGDNAANG